MARRFNPKAMKNLRELQGLNCREFGRRLGYSAAQVAQVEGGRNPSLNYIYRVVDVFRIDIASIWI